MSASAAIGALVDDSVPQDGAGIGLLGITAAPLHLRGGVGSPGNALAIR